MLKLYLHHGCRIKYTAPDRTFASLFDVKWFQDSLILKAIEDIDCY